MKRRSGYVIITALLLLNACMPAFNYKVQAPAGWSVRDTFIAGSQVRLILPQSQLDGRPSVNIVVIPMEGKGIENFTSSNILYLRTHMEGITITDRGGMYIAGLDSRWFTYNKVHNGVTRELINYIIPTAGYAYMITGGTDSGHLADYQPVFDDIASSFKR